MIRIPRKWKGMVAKGGRWLERLVMFEGICPDFMDNCLITCGATWCVLIEDWRIYQKDLLDYRMLAQLSTNRGILILTNECCVYFSSHTLRLLRDKSKRWRTKLASHSAHNPRVQWYVLRDSEICPSPRTTGHLGLVLQVPGPRRKAHVS